MTLVDLLEHIQYDFVRGTTDKEIYSLEYNSKEVKENSVFFAIDGHVCRGSMYITDAIKRGATVIVVNSNLSKIEGIESNVTIIGVKDVRKALAYMSARFYNNPSEELQVIGVTGTKGKTSVTFMIRHILESAGIKTGIIGTVIKGYNDNFTLADSTTPQAPEIQRLMREMVEAGCKALVMEVSSQGLKHSRVDGINFNIGVFTNISPDHIGGAEHANFEEYLYCKSLLFDACDKAVINGDCDLWRHTIENKELKRKILFGRREDNDVIYYDCALIRQGEKLGTEFKLKSPEFLSNDIKVSLELAGYFNAENAVASIATARLLGIPQKIIVKSLRDVVIPGRVEIVPIEREFTAMVDYAHNGMALESLLNSLREYDPSRLVLVMGCGGDRDRNRRFDMGKAALKLADYIIITSDNPRTENPQDIIDDITSVMTFCDKVILAIPDRREAIKRAMKDARKDDIIIVAGKGHETYQIIGNEITWFDDKEVILSCGKEAQ